ncbi:MAG: outer membrane lipoprotein carrier protein LolA [Proteobacteria bacterium]|nr:outer membrane lipoprotein carrier protein LolA [Pseudomonadota bacterium]
MKRFVLAALALSPCAFAAAPPDLAATILAHLAKPGSAQTEFIEVAYRGMLDRPLVTSGTMQWLGGDKLERDVQKPYKAVAKIGDGRMSVQRGDGAVQSMPIERAPQMAAILAGFRALLGGDAAQLSRDFEVKAAGNEARWVLTLTPRAGELKARVQSIQIDGRGDAPRCMTLSEGDGDTTITLVGAMARAGLQSSAPLQSALAARCRND